MRTTATNHHGRVAAIVLVSIALAPGAAATTDASTPPSEPERIPDGSYSRIATAETGIAAGLDPEVAEEMARLVIDGDRWTQQRHERHRHRAGPRRWDIDLQRGRALVPLILTVNQGSTGRSRTASSRCGSPRLPTCLTTSGS